MKGIILAGGAGTRLRPLTRVTSKQLLPIYNKPMIYYPLGTLLDAGITEILIIMNPEHAGTFINLLGSGKEFGARFTYEVQEAPEGLSQAFVIGEKFIGRDNVTLILGDNIFEDQKSIARAIQQFKKGGLIFAKEVKDPERYGVVQFDSKMKAKKIVEKPKKWLSDFAIPGIYVYDNQVIEAAKKAKKSPRGEYEITDMHNFYLKKKELQVKTIEGAWFDAGTLDSYYETSRFVYDLKKSGHELGTRDMKHGDTPR